MADGPSLEQFRIDQNPPSNLSRLVDEAKRVQRIVAHEFRVVRSDSQTVNPPIEILNDRVLHRLVHPALAVKPKGPVICAYQPLTDIVHISESFAKSSNRQNMTLMIAEELTHAQTTRDLGGSVRVAYATYPYSREKSQLPPGAVYDLSKKGFDEIHDEKSITVRKDRDTVLLLERATLLSLHLMIDRLLGKDYPLLVLVRQKEQPLTIIKDRQLLMDVLGSMYLNNPRLLPKNVLAFFQDPRPLSWASFGPGRNGSTDMVGMSL